MFIYVSGRHIDSIYADTLMGPDFCGLKASFRDFISSSFQGFNHHSCVITTISEILMCIWVYGGTCSLKVCSGREQRGCLLCVICMNYTAIIIKQWNCLFIFIPAQTSENRIQFIGIHLWKKAVITWWQLTMSWHMVCTSTVLYYVISTQSISPGPVLCPRYFYVWKKEKSTYIKKKNKKNLINPRGK